MLNIEKVTATLYPGLQKFHQDLIDTDLKSLPTPKHPNEDLVTCKEWLEAEGLTLDHGTLLSFARAMGNRYRSTTGKTGQMKHGTNKPLGMGYPPQYNGLFELAYQSIKHKIK